MDRNPVSDLFRPSSAESRRVFLASCVGILGPLGFMGTANGNSLFTTNQDEFEKKLQASVERGLRWLGSKQSQLGHWNSDYYPTAITALAGVSLICSGSTTVQGPYAKNIRLCVDYLITKCRKNGLIGDPQRDDRYTYGHGFSMLFLSQVLGEEEDGDRRTELTEILERAVAFSASAQTKAGGWGYVSGEDDSFDEGSTTITQVQGLRACRNAGIVVPKKVIDDAVKYIYACKNKDGGISYSSGSKGDSRAPITAAALAALYNAGDYSSPQIPSMWAYCKKTLHDPNNNQYGHWHYAYLYYSQVVYRQGDKEWGPFRAKLFKKIMDEQKADGSWEASDMDATYSTCCNLIMLQLDQGLLPIYQR